jgi:hypothetical protein
MHSLIPPPLLLSFSLYSVRFGLLQWKLKTLIAGTYRHILKNAYVCRC